MRKELVIIITLLLVTISLDAQTQYGYVKTKGRLASNGVVVAGKKISGVTIQVKGRSAVLSQSNGTFSFPIPAQNYYLQSVQKQGFVMTDPDMLSRQYAYSKNPLVLVLETKEQQTDDKLAAERKIRKTLQRQLQEKEDEIESLKKQQKLSEEEYRKQLQEMYAQQESNEKLISEMADRYSRMDFDQMDDFNRQVNYLIINGRLLEADSLLNKKGNIRERILILDRHHEANIQQRENLEKSEFLEQRQREEIAQDCYNKYKIFEMKYEKDSALFYIRLRADLDSTNIAWQEDAGYGYLYGPSDIKEKKIDLTYQLRALRQAKMQYDEESKKVADLYFNVGFSHQALAESLRSEGQTDQSLSYFQTMLDYYLKAMSSYKHTLGEVSEEIEDIYAFIGMGYFEIGDPDTSWDYYLKSLDVKKKRLGDNAPEVLDYQNTITEVRYLTELTTGHISRFVEENCFYITIHENAQEELPAGKYILLEYDDWKQDSPNLVHDKEWEMSFKPFDIVIYENGKVARHHVNNKVTFGITVTVEFMGKREKKVINKAYEKWREQRTRQ